MTSTIALIRYLEKRFFLEGRGNGRRPSDSFLRLKKPSYLRQARTERLERESFRYLERHFSVRPRGTVTVNPWVCFGLRKMRLSRDTLRDVILTGAYLDTQVLGTVHVACTWRSERTIARAQAGADEVRRRGVPLAYRRWLGRNPTSAERRALSRALIRLEAEGYLVRRGRRRTSHVKLTSAGERLAQAIFGTPDGEPFLWLLPEDVCGESNAESMR